LARSFERVPRARQAGGIAKRRFFRQRLETVGERKKNDALQDIILDYVRGTP
jgi:hypothetical protein